MNTVHGTFQFETALNLLFAEGVAYILDAFFLVFKSSATDGT